MAVICLSNVSQRGPDSKDVWNLRLILVGQLLYEEREKLKKMQHLDIYY